MDPSAPAPPVVTPFTLDGQLCFALYSASRAMTAAYREYLVEVDLTYTQYVVLLLLWEREPMAMRDLSEHLHLDSATLSPLLQRMEGRGLVARRRMESDERVVEVSCTDQGRGLREQVHGIQQRVEARTGLAAGELASMREDLHLLADRLRADPDA